MALQGSGAVFSASRLLRLAAVLSLIVRANMVGGVAMERACRALEENLCSGDFEAAARSAGEVAKDCLPLTRASSNSFRAGRTWRTQRVGVRNRINGNLLVRPPRFQLPHLQRQKVPSATPLSCGTAMLAAHSGEVLLDGVLFHPGGHRALVRDHHDRVRAKARSQGWRATASRALLSSISHEAPDAYRRGLQLRLISVVRDHIRVPTAADSPRRGPCGIVGLIVEQCPCL